MSRTVTASDFYRHPGGELEQVARDREPLVVLRRGVPLVRIEPVDREGNVVSNGEGEDRYEFKTAGVTFRVPAEAEDELRAALRSVGVLEQP